MLRTLLIALLAAKALYISWSSGFFQSLGLTPASGS